MCGIVGFAGICLAWFIIVTSSKTIAEDEDVDNFRCGGFFECNSGTCIPVFLKCNGVDDCGDGSDESEDCPIVCKTDEFKCASLKVCIPNSTICDGLSNCADFSDELNCTRCSSGASRCRLGGCVPNNLICDSEPNCSDGSDKVGCVTQPTGSIILAAAFGLAFFLLVLSGIFICIRHKEYYSFLSCI